MKVCYITHSAPCGKVESFVVQEIIAIKKLCRVVIVPMRPLGPPQYREAEMLMYDSIVLPLINFRILVNFVITLFTTPILVFSDLSSLIKESVSLRVLFRNLCVLPKAYYVAKLLKDMNIDHIHCHWASMQTTFGLIVARILGVGFSFTAHRYDIYENNLLRKKVLESSFVRVISEDGKSKIIELTDLAHLQDKIYVIHMGVKVPEGEAGFARENGVPVIACPAELVDIKGHRYLIECCALLKSSGIPYKCLIIGHGPNVHKIRSMIAEKKLENEVFLERYYPHSKLMKIMSEGKIDTVVLPSITLKDGTSEGIPVALMEAMSFKIPVVSTRTGGIPELLGDMSGIMVEEKNSPELAEAIAQILSDDDLRQRLTINGFQRVFEDFNIERNCRWLFDLITESVERQDISAKPSGR